MDYIVVIGIVEEYAIKGACVVSSIAWILSKV